MLATFVLAEPAWVAVAFAALVAVATYLRLARRAWPGPAAAEAGPAPGEAGPSSSVESVSAQRPLGRRWVLLAVGVAALLVAALLVVAKTPAAHALLLVLGVAAAFVLSVESYRRRRTRLSFESAAFCVLARVLAWLLALLMIGQPRWDWVVVEWEEPLLAVLLDQSRSMSITDRESPEEQSRAESVNQAITDARPSIDRLDDLYEVQRFGLGEECKVLEGWRVVPQAPVSAIAAALRQVGQRRSVHGEPPIAVLLISDGAENAVNPQVVREVAEELAAQRTAMLAVGVGPAGVLTPAVVLDPLVVPGRIASRDRVRVPVTAHVTGCAGRAVRVSVLWGDQVVEERRVRIERAAQPTATEFELQPPGVGLHRLTARVTLPTVLGGGSFGTSVVVDVGDDRIRVLMLEGQPRNELTFAARAVGADARFELTQRRLLGAAGELETGAPATELRWSDYDVVILGNVPKKRLDFDTLADLADAVRERGVGLLMVGGRAFYHEGYYSRSDLQDVSPVGFKLGRPADDYRPRFRPTESGRRHPVLLGVDEPAAPGVPTAQPSEFWDGLPALSGAARFGKPKPLAAVLAADESGRPLLAALDVGRGRTIAAGWDSTWPWALSSAEGLAAHGRFWRQMVAWLANRRPVAWVVTDRSSYVQAALTGGQQKLRIRAGLSGVETPSESGRPAEFKASLRLRLVRADNADQPTVQEEAPTVTAAGPPTTTPAGSDWTIPLRRRGNEWRAELPEDLRTQAWLTSGEYELLFVVEQTVADESSTPAAPDQPGDGKPLALTARTGFTVTAVDLELLEPTANLGLLREAAARTESVGGGYYSVDELSEAVRRLAEDDRRRRIERPAAYDLVGQQRWSILLLVTAALVLEWVVRKRGGLA